MKENWPDWNVYKLGGCTCVYCDFSGLNDFNSWRQLAIDHLIPVSRGGSNTPDNKVVSCHRCNTLKGSWNPLEGDEQPSVISEEYRFQLIARVKKYLRLEDSEERKDFDRMMDELKDGGFKTAA
jgi:5-methylcytosine-specific restriction endonuclease McrA